MKRQKEEKNHKDIRVKEKRKFAKEIINYFSLKYKSSKVHKLSTKAKWSLVMRKKEDFLKLQKNFASVLLRVKGTLGGKDITISIACPPNNNYVSTKFTNQLVIPESNITEKIGLWNEKQYDISNLQLNIGDYTFVSPFTIGSLWSDDGDILLGSPWMETLGSFILNTERRSF
jgi:hypothetical protein